MPDVLPENTFPAAVFHNEGIQAEDTETTELDTTLLSIHYIQLSGLGTFLCLLKYAQCNLIHSKIERKNLSIFKKGPTTS